MFDFRKMSNGGLYLLDQNTGLVTANLE
jgi:hypothetical protein